MHFGKKKILDFHSKKKKKKKKIHVFNKHNIILNYRWNINFFTYLYNFGGFEII